MITSMLYMVNKNDTLKVKARSRVSDQKGFTLVELIVAIAIFSLVIGIIWSFFMYNLRLYNISQESADVQFQTRQASDYLINELQFVRSASISDNSLPERIDQASLASKHPIVSEISFELIPSTSSYLLRIVLTGSNGDPSSNYNLETTITLKNVNGSENGESDTLYFEP